MDANDQAESIQQIATRMGLPTLVKGARVSPSTSNAKKRLLEAAADIRSQRDDQRPMGFLATFLVQCTMPHSNPGDVPIWRRRNNEYTLAIQPGWDMEANCSLGYPWGTLPRVLLIWIVTTVKQTGCRRVELGNTLGEFLKKLELDPYSRGKNSDAVRIKEAMRKLFNAKIFFYSRNLEGSIVTERNRDASVVSESELLWDKNPADHAVLWGSWIEVGENFFAEIMRSSVPCNTTALKALRKSPLALDLYMLCNWIGANLQAQGKRKHRLSWGMLGEQLGGEYGSDKDLKKNIQKAMVKVRLAHPDLVWRYDTWKIPGKTAGTTTLQGGLVIFPSAPAIQRRQQKIA